MSKFRECDIDYITERMDQVAELLGDVFKEYADTGDIEEVDHKLASAIALVMLVTERLEKMNK